jgi:hypothetical protein
MKAYLFETGTVIEPFGDPVSSAFLGGETLGEAVARALGRWDLTIEKVKNTDEVPLKGDYLVLPDTLLLTRRCLGEFLQATAGGRRPSRLALLKSTATEYPRPLTELDQEEDAVAYDLFRLQGIELPRGMNWAQLKGFLSARAENLVLDPKPEIERLPLTRPGPPRETLDLPRTTLLAADVRHWVHLVWINHQLPWVRLREYWEDHPGLKRAWRSRGRNPYRQAIRLSVVGEKCDIHPTATVEGSILGDGVKIGAFCSVRDCIVGDGVDISDYNKFLRCVVGGKCNTLIDSYFVGCTFYPQSTLSSFMLRNSVVGRRVFITSAVMFWDEPVSEPVAVMRGGQETPTGRWMLGGCSGHECILGVRAIFLPGRAVPNQSMIVLRPDESVAKLPANAAPGAPHIYNLAGSILPLDQGLPGWNPPEYE